MKQCSHICVVPQGGDTECRWFAARGPLPPPLAKLRQSQQGEGKWRWCNKQPERERGPTPHFIVPHGPSVAANQCRHGHAGQGEGEGHCKCVLQTNWARLTGALLVSFQRPLGSQSPTPMEQPDAVAMMPIQLVRFQMTRTNIQNILTL